MLLNVICNARGSSVMKSDPAPYAHSVEVMKPLIRQAE